jgi:hypothetical protein
VTALWKLTTPNLIDEENWVVIQMARRTLLLLLQNALGKVR